MAKNILKQPNQTKTTKKQSAKYLLIPILLITLISPIVPMCQLPKKEQKKISTVIFKEFFDETKGKHDEELDGCMRDDFRVQWFEVFFENSEERERVEKINEEMKKKKEAEFEKKSNNLMSFLEMPETPEIPESGYYFAVLAINYKEVKPLRLPMLPPLKTPPEEPFKPIQVMIRARLGSYTDEVKRSVASSFKNPLVSNMMKSSFDPNALTAKFIKGFKFDKEPNCNPQIEENPLHPKKIKNVVFMQNCKKGEVRNRRLRLETYNKILDGDEYVYGIKLRQLEFCKKEHHGILPQIAKKKPMFYKLFGCWYKNYPIKIVDKVVEEIDKWLDTQRAKEIKEIKDFEEQHVSWSDHEELARKKIEEEKKRDFLEGLRTQKKKGIEDLKRRFKDLKEGHEKARVQRRRRKKMKIMKKTQKRSKKRRRRKRRRKSLKGSLGGNVLSKGGQGGLLGKKGGLGVLSKNRKYGMSSKSGQKKKTQKISGLKGINSEKAAAIGVAPWMGNLLSGINLNPMGSLQSKKSKKSSLTRNDKSKISKIYRDSGHPLSKSFDGGFTTLGLWGNKHKKKRKKSKKKKVWGWHNYHNKSGRIRNWKTAFKKERKLFMPGMPKPPGFGKPPKKEPFVWPKNPAFEFSLVYNSMMTKDIFFRQETFKLNKKEFEKLILATGESSPVIPLEKPKLEDIPEDKFPKFVERNGKVYKVVYQDVDQTKEEQKKEKKENAEKRLKMVKDQTKFLYLEKKLLYELRKILREIRVTEVELVKYEKAVHDIQKDKLNTSQDAKVTTLKTDIEKKIQELDLLEQEKEKIKSELAAQKHEKIKLEDTEMPKELTIVDKLLTYYDRQAGRVQSKSMTMGQEHKLNGILKKIKNQLEKYSARVKSEGKQEEKKMAVLEVQKKESPKKEAEKEAGLPKPDSVKCLLITVGMHFLALGPLVKKITAANMVPAIKKAFPELDLEGLTPKVEDTSIDFLDADEAVKESIGFIKKEHKKFVLGQIEPFVYQRWLFAREALEVFFIDELKHYTTITEQEAEAKHREYLKKKNAHFQEIYNEMKKENEEESNETNKNETSKIDALVVNRRTKSLRVLAQKNQESNDQEMFNWLHV